MLRRSRVAQVRLSGLIVSRAVVLQRDERIRGSLEEIQAMLVILAVAGVVAATLSSYSHAARRRNRPAPRAVQYGRYVAWAVFAAAAYGVARQIGLTAR